MRLYELLPMEGKDMFGYFLALRWLKCIFCSFSKTTTPGQSLRGILTTFSTTSKCLRWRWIVYSSLIWLGCAGVHWHRGTNLPNGRDLLQRGLQGSHEPGWNINKLEQKYLYFVVAQITHTEEMPESMMMKNAVISVFFLRFLQHGKYFKRHVPEKKKVCFLVNLVKTAAKKKFNFFHKQTQFNLMHNNRPVEKTLLRNVHKRRKT